MAINGANLDRQDHQTLWQAVQSRDQRLDGAFVYGVRSTGVYCRPTCPSRRPRREQVSFFATADEAEQAGFRPCLRCHPRNHSAPSVELARRVREYIDVHVDQGVTLADLGRVFNMSPFHLQRTFKQALGVTPKQYAASRRLGQLKAQLKNGRAVTTALYDAGYNTSSRLYEAAPGWLGMTPSEYRRGGAGMDIHYTVVDSALGRLLVATTERGVCMVSLGDEDAPLEAALRAEYPHARLARNDGALIPWVQAVVDYLAGQQVQLDVPLDVQATAFQWRVWEALRAIPYGSTRTYHEIATQLGNPKAARAVGHACATNPVALIIPCHRAVRVGGRLGGYRWGLERKRRLLTQEKGAIE
jgi:AraC family transcriptional regulator of adaptative response/methylated-DNA-[protein]-cysteine methyltransferase